MIHHLKPNIKFHTRKFGLTFKYFGWSNSLKMVYFWKVKRCGSRKFESHCEDQTGFELTEESRADIYGVCHHNQHFSLGVWYFLFLCLFKSMVCQRGLSLTMLWSSASTMQILGLLKFTNMPGLMSYRRQKQGLHECWVRTLPTALHQQSRLFEFSLA